MTAPTVWLGRELFFAKSLSLEGDVACVSCHHPSLAGGDALSLPIGTAAVDPDLLGPGRVYDWRDRGKKDPHAAPGPNVARNSPTVFNVGLYERALFHDGRVQKKRRGGFRSPESARDSGRDMLGVQARLPVASEVEMRGFNALRYAPPDRVRSRLIERLGNNSAWREAFARAFGDETISYDRIETALSDYQLTFVLDDAPWFTFTAGDDAAISAQAKRGAVLFFSAREKGGAGCVTCHSGSFFTDEAFHVLAIPQIGRGKARTEGGFKRGTVRDGTDKGRWEATRVSRFQFAFRTPTLLNINVTGPYGHSGAYETLEEVVRHHLDPVDAISRFDFSLGGLSQFRASGVRYDHAESATKAALGVWQAGGGQRIDLDDQAVADLVAFLEALTDPCVASPACLAPWLPDPTTPSPDGTRLNAKFTP
ncbi:MAG: cytochrome-c peroxidase [Chromatiales bacterium]|nr:cytochrome-c peroxidase [Chromatiales bacterium]